MYIIVTRNPRSGRLIVVSDADGDPAQFKTEDDAHEAAKHTVITRAWGYKVISVD